MMQQDLELRVPTYFFIFLVWYIFLGFILLNWLQSFGQFICFYLGNMGINKQIMLSDRSKKAATKTHVPIFK